MRMPWLMDLRLPDEEAEATRILRQRNARTMPGRPWNEDADLMPVG